MWVACFSLLLAGVFAGWAHFTSCGLHPADARRAARLAMGGNIHFFLSAPVCVLYIITKEIYRGARKRRVACD
jgi:hypothetical protein